AMSAGCAIITTNISGNRQLVGDCGVLVQPGELNSLRNTVADLAANPGECERLGTLAATRARQHYDWCVIGQRYLDLLGDLTSNKKAA
ncbi:MAG: glycosyltransferase, partial [Planctomycetota bacterium]